MPARQSCTHSACLGNILRTIHYCDEAEAHDAPRQGLNTAVFWPYEGTDCERQETRLEKAVETKACAAEEKSAISQPRPAAKKRAQSDYAPDESFSRRADDDRVSRRVDDDRAEDEDGVREDDEEMPEAKQRGRTKPVMINLSDGPTTHDLSGLGAFDHQEFRALASSFVPICLYRNGVVPGEFLRG